MFVRIRKFAVLYLRMSRRNNKKRRQQRRGRNREGASPQEDASQKVEAGNAEAAARAEAARNVEAARARLEQDEAAARASSDTATQRARAEASETSDAAGSSTESSAGDETPKPKSKKKGSGRVSGFVKGGAKLVVGTAATPFVFAFRGILSLVGRVGGFLKKTFLDEFKEWDPSNISGFYNESSKKKDKESSKKKDKK